MHGVSQIDRLMESIATKAGLEVAKKQFINHSPRKTTVTKLRKLGASNREIIVITVTKVNRAWQIMIL